MSRTTAQHRDADPAQQLTLLSQGELAVLRSSSVSQPKSDVAFRKARRLQDGEERFIQRPGATQPKLPGF